MIFNEMLEVVKKLNYDEKKIIYSNGYESIWIIRPSELSKRFKNYDREKNFQIFITQGSREFRPNHLRVMIDLNLRVRCREDLKEKLLFIFDEIFYGEDPEKLVEEIEDEEFSQYLNSIKVIAILSQLFLVEQAYAYYRESNYDPPTLFYQGWIREVIDSPKEIDNLTMSICSRRACSAKYVNKENKKSKKYECNLDKLWYLKNS